MGIRFRVRDNGIGMSPEFLPHLYDPFSQERSEENITENLMDARIYWWKITRSTFMWPS